MYYLKKYIFGKGFHFAWSYGKKLQPPAYVLRSLKWFKRLLAFSKQCVEMGPGASYRIALWSAGTPQT